MAQIQLTDGIELHPWEESILRHLSGPVSETGPDFFSVLLTYKGGDDVEIPKRHRRRVAHRPRLAISPAAGR